MCHLGAPARVTLEALEKVPTSQHPLPLTSPQSPTGWCWLSPASRMLPSLATAGFRGVLDTSLGSWWNPRSHPRVCCFHSTDGDT